MTQAREDSLEALLGEAGLPPDADALPPAPPKRRRRGLRIAIVCLCVLMVLTGSGAVAGAMWFNKVTAQIDKNLGRIGDPFATISRAGRAPVDPSAEKALNVLLVGSDSRISGGDPAQWVYGAQRTDTIMLLHLAADRREATIISIPRDSWVEIPGHGTAKINAAYSYGGPPLMIRTVEQLTHVHIDHFALLDFTGFVTITNELGGVVIKVPKATHDTRATFKAGTYRMNGATALNYVRERHGLPNGDFDRVRRQQNWMRAVAKELIRRSKISNPDTLTGPSRFLDPLNILAKSVATDDGFTLGEMRGLALSMQGSHTTDLIFMTAPVKRTGRSPDHTQSIVVLDLPKMNTLWKAVAADKVDPWLQKYKPQLLPQTVN